ncbi:MAG TPA: proton-conducting transporter membrane subunit, partial [Anaeromyxobacteraceae bacterium]|nr:proton-conducting transporter membrane subunit [Anaeromyxobacteraceae bacterium]
MEIQTYLAVENVRSAGWFQPELWLTFGTLALFLLDVFWRKSPRRAGLMLVATLAVLFGAAAALAFQPATPQALFNGLIVNDAFAIFFKWIFLAGAVLTVLIAAPSGAFPAALVGQFYALLVSIVLGLFLMASASDLLMVFMSIELVSMVSYVLAGFTRGNRKASEAALKYVIFGGVASGVMVFGMSYLYGLLQTTNVLEFAARLHTLPSTWPVKLALVLAIA